MSLDQDARDDQLTLLAAHRRTLAHLLEQAAAYGGEVLAPPQTATGIAAARTAIHQIKAALYGAGVPIEDEPNDGALPTVRQPSPHSNTIGPHIQSTNNVTENYGTIIGTNIGSQTVNYYQHTGTSLDRQQQRNR